MAGGDTVYTRRVSQIATRRSRYPRMLGSATGRLVLSRTVVISDQLAPSEEVRRLRYAIEGGSLTHRKRQPLLNALRRKEEPFKHDTTVDWTTIAQHP